MSKLFLQLNSISYLAESSFGLSKKILSNVELKISEENKNNFHSILAPMGTGKTTLLKILCGLLKPSSGEIFIEDEKIVQPNGKIVFIPAESSSLPWLNVKQNIEFALNLSGTKEIEKNISKFLRLVELEGYENHYPNKKSLGFRFRISLAQALAVSPKLILIDSPFLNMNYETKEELIGLLKKISSLKNIKFILATSSLNEAIELSQKIFLLNGSPAALLGEIDIDENEKLNNPDYERIIKAKIDCKLKESNLLQSKYFIN